MEYILETKRLLFREFTPADATLIYELNSDPEVIKYTLDPIVNIEQAETILKEIIVPQYSLYNHGRWALHTKNNNEFIGWCGLKHQKETGEIDLGYRLKKSEWGKGYATEAAKATIDYGLKKLGLQCITGRALPGNDASVHVMEKCGMNPIGIQKIEGLDHHTFQITNQINNHE